MIAQVWWCTRSCLCVYGAHKLLPYLSEYRFFFHTHGHMHIRMNLYTVFSVCVPSKVLFILSLLPHLSGLGHVCPVGEGLEQAADVLVFGPGGTDGELLLTLDYTPEDTQTKL